MLQRGYGENETTAISSRKKRSWRRVEKGWERLKLTHAIGQKREVVVITYNYDDGFDERDEKNTNKKKKLQIKEESTKRTKKRRKSVVYNIKSKEQRDRGRR